MKGGDTHTQKKKTRPAHGAEFLQDEKTARACCPLGQGRRRGDTWSPCCGAAGHRAGLGAPHPAPRLLAPAGQRQPCAQEQGAGAGTCPPCSSLLASQHPESVAPPSTGRRLAQQHGRVGAHPATLEGLTQPGGGSQPSLPADLWPGFLNWLYYSELEGSAWPCQTPVGLLRHAVPGLQSHRCLPEHVPQPALSWQEPALAPRPDFPNPRWRLTCSRHISRHFWEH